VSVSVCVTKHDSDDIIISSHHKLQKRRPGKQEDKSRTARRRTPTSKTHMGANLRPEQLWGHNANTSRAQARTGNLAVARAHRIADTQQRRSSPELPPQNSVVLMVRNLVHVSSMAFGPPVDARRRSLEFPKVAGVQLSICRNSE